MGPGVIGSVAVGLGSVAVCDGDGSVVGVGVAVADGLVAGDADGVVAGFGVVVGEAAAGRVDGCVAALFVDDWVRPAVVGVAVGEGDGDGDDGVGVGIAHGLAESVGGAITTDPVSRAAGIWSSEPD